MFRTIIALLTLTLTLLLFCGCGLKPPPESKNWTIPPKEFEIIKSGDGLYGVKRIRDQTPMSKRYLYYDGAVQAAWNMTWEVVSPNNDNTKIEKE